MWSSGFRVQRLSIALIRGEHRVEIKLEFWSIGSEFGVDGFT